MFGIVLLPVFTNCMVAKDHQGDQKGKGVAVYIANIAYLRICSFLIALTIWNDEHIWKDKKSHGLVPAFLVEKGIGIVFLALAVLLCALFHWGYFGVALLDYPVMKLVEWRWPQIGRVERSVSLSFGGFAFLLTIPRLVLVRVRESRR